MSLQARPERVTQNRVVALLTQLGYTHLGDWHQRADNRAIETALLRANLQARAYTEAEINAALHKLEAAASVKGSSLSEANQRTYHLLRYGAAVQLAAGQAHKTVHFIDWDHPERNDFALAEEVTLKEGHQRRPDIVLYVNGLAWVLLELKRGSVEVGDGVRQLCTNQEPSFNPSFFSTVQLLLAGNDSQGVRYGTTGTPESFFANWKANAPNTTSTLSVGALLDAPLAELCQPQRLLDWVRHFVIFDGGRKKVPRQHQFEGIKAAQQRIAQREGGVIWHTQGSGKSILMVLLAKWLLEHDPHARILVVTDREELDKQIVGVMRNAGVIGSDAPSPRVESRAELVQLLGATLPRLMCALIHKFDTANLSGPVPHVHGHLYVLVDECHRTQGGDMNKQMKRWLHQALFIGFTGTPLLRADKPLTRDVFGTYIHTYKFHEAVHDKVVLDLKYQARAVSEHLTSPDKIDQWFESHTKSLNGFQKALVRKRWATMEALMSAEGRKRAIIAEIMLDFACKPRLNNDRGTAMLVASSIYDACHYFRLFQATSLGRHCGLITSYEPNHNAISREPNQSDERYKYDTYVQYVLTKQGQSPQQYADEVKRLFIEQPAQMKLLIVVSKLLTGFDAPSCTYIYLDHELHDHNLFQAICRTNRLDGDDKDYGYIVDFKQLFGHVQEAISVYSSDALDTDQGNGGDNNIHLKQTLQEGKRQLDEALQGLDYLCQPVLPPRELEHYLLYFCGHASDPLSLTDTEALRVSLYKAVAQLTRAYAELVQDLIPAGYTPAQAATLHEQVRFYADLRAAIKKHAGEELDIKPYEADMRHLLNTYIHAETTALPVATDQLSLLEMIVQTGIHDAIAKKLNAKGQLSNRAVAEGIIHNVRQTIARMQLTDPRFYAQMSALLEDLIQQSHDDAAAYADFLRQAQDLIVKLMAGQPLDDVPAVLHGKNEAIVVFRHLDGLACTHFQCPTDDEAKANLALQIDSVMRTQAPAGWHGDQTKERLVQGLLYPLLHQDAKATYALFDLIQHQQGYR